MPPESSQVGPMTEEVAPKKKWVFVDMVDGCDTWVILFGWAGCQQRYLAKYAQFYKEAGLSTICYTAPIAKIRAFSSYTQIANYFWKEIKPFFPEPNNIFFHVFSMNGCSLFTALWDTLQMRENGNVFKSKVRGVLFDSSPAHTSPSQSANAVSFATFPPAHYNAAVRNSYRAVLFTFFSVQRGIMYMRSFLDSEVYEKNFAYFRLINISDLPDNQLYLYGPGDEVCSAESIEYFASEMGRQQKNVNLKSMNDSLHCAHYRTHPEFYRDACLQFIDRYRGDFCKTTGEKEEITKPIESNKSMFTKRKKHVFYHNNASLMMPNEFCDASNDIKEKFLWGGRQLSNQNDLKTAITRQ